MLVPLSWLRDFAPLPVDAAALGDVFDDLGMVVEAVTHIGAGLEDVVVAHVLEIAAIPGADKIRRVMVDAGGRSPVQIVCGAWNFEVGDDVPLAPVGAVLPGDFRIGRRTMKGVASEGMLCSARELGLGDDAAGLLVLRPGHPPGQSISDALGVTADVVFDLAIEANRPDANCIAGVARDAAARLAVPFAIRGSALTHPPDATPFAVRVAAPDLCDRFTVTVFDGVRVGPSPAWVAARLTLAGMRPISNVVDASNYVMLELGQPTHAYDLDRLPGPALGARAARRGEGLTTLDDVERILGDGTNPDCVIVDANDAVIGIGGVMGGASSEVHGGTTRVALEAAHFVPMAIARTSKRLGLRSEASARFERGVDIEGIDRAVARFASILAETCPALAAVGAPVDWRAEAAPPPHITVRVDRVNVVLGTALPAEDIASLLRPIGFDVEHVEGLAGTLDVLPPTFRPDVGREVEVIEEIARHHGYSNIARTTVRPLQVGGLSDHQRARRAVRLLLQGAGISEASTGPLVGPGDHARAGLAEDGVRASDPLVVEESVLRTSLRPVLLRAVAFNVDRRMPDVHLFEIGKVWPPSSSGSPLPPEVEVLGVVLAGSAGGAPAAVQVLRRLASGLHVRDLALEAGTTPGLHPTRTAAVSAGGLTAGWVGEIDPQVTDAWGIAGPVGWIEIDLTALLGARPSTVVARPVSRFPSSDIDLAFVVDEAVSADLVERTLAEAAGDLLEWVSLFDVYRGPGVANGARSLAFRLRVSAMDRTLGDADLSAVRAACIDAVTAKHGGVLRS